MPAKCNILARLGYVNELDKTPSRFVLLCVAVRIGVEKLSQLVASQLVCTNSKHKGDRIHEVALSTPIWPAMQSTVTI